jgi:predicted PurR-regulated permease PerM
MIQKYKHEIIIAALLIGSIVAFYYLYGILLPFILGLLLAFTVKPLITQIQRLVKSRGLATTIFLAVVVSSVILILVFFTRYINQDFKRLNNSFTTLVSNNKENLDKTARKVKEYIGNIYDFEEIEKKVKFQPDSLKAGLQELDTDAIKAAFEEITSVFKSGEESVEDEKTTEFSTIVILFSTIFYFVLILYQIDYFSSLRRRYFSRKVKSKLDVIIDDFNKSFVKYFKLRTKIILLLSLIYIIAFIILDMPGLILLTIIIVLLSYIPYLQYIALIPLSIGCLVLSIENDQSFLLLFGIVAGVFILASIIEELVLNPWIMEKNIGMNPVIMVLGLSVWSYLLGLQGLLIGIPLTSLLIIYFKRYLLTSYQEVLQDKS